MNPSYQKLFIQFQMVNNNQSLEEENDFCQLGKRLLEEAIQD
jgi:hypothetical protein